MVQILKEIWTTRIERHNVPQYRVHVSVTVGVSLLTTVAVKLMTRVSMSWFGICSSWGHLDMHGSESMPAWAEAHLCDDKLSIIGHLDINCWRRCLGIWVRLWVSVKLWIERQKLLPYLALCDNWQLPWYECLNSLFSFIPVFNIVPTCVSRSMSCPTWSWNTRRK